MYSWQRLERKSLCGTEEFLEALDNGLKAKMA